jgi:hypothetical protein
MGSFGLYPASLLGYRRAALARDFLSGRIMNDAASTGYSSGEGGRFDLGAGPDVRRFA